LVSSAPPRSIGRARAVELMFAAHGPWSLWLVAVAVVELLTPAMTTVIASAIVPLAWTALLLQAFCREVLGLSPRQARSRVFAHQAFTILVVLVCIDLATGLSVRVLGVFAR
jgi:hypothetical protein